jgi:hypothetical protein
MSLLALAPAVLGAGVIGGIGGYSTAMSLILLILQDKSSLIDTVPRD